MADYVALKDLPVGAKFIQEERFDDGSVRYTEGEVIGHTTRQWVAIEMSCKYRKYLPDEEGVAKHSILYTGPGWFLFHHQTPVRPMTSAQPKEGKE